MSVLARLRPGRRRTGAGAGAPAGQPRRRPEPVRRQHRLVPPEGVPLTLGIASLGARFGAQLTDLAITGIATLALIITLSALVDAPVALIEGVAALAFFAIRTPYYVASELVWAGRTPGKRLLRLRVIAADGRALSTHAVVLRNLMKEAEVFVPGTLLLMIGGSDPVSALLMASWIAIVLAIPLVNRRRQRLGDILAGTVVVEEPQALLMPELAAEAGARFTFQPHHLDHYGAYELQTLERVLRTAEEGRRGSAGARQAETLKTIVEKIRARIDYPDAVADADTLAFLQDFYAAQRQHLEARQLMGDRRADKHHRAVGRPQPNAERESGG